MPRRIHIAPLLLLTLSLALLAGCHKDPAFTSSGSHLVRSETTTSPGGIPYTVSYTYDSSGRQVQSQTDTVVKTYVYATDTITETTALAGHYFITGFTTNAAGLIISDSKFFHYGYDPDGYLTSLSYTCNGNYDSTTYTISTGDLISSVEHQADAATDNRVTTNYTYLSSLDSRDFGMTSSTGRRSTHLVSTESIVQLINGSRTTISYTFTYTFDAQGRVTQQVRTSGSVSYTTTYTY